MGSGNCKRAYALVAGVLLGLSPAARGAEPIRATVEALRSLPDEERYAWGVVPAEAKPLLRELKRWLAEEARQSLPAAQELPADLAGVTVTMEERLRASEIVVGEDPPDGALGYGYVKAIDFWRIPGHREWVAFTSRLDIPCGFDDSLYVFRRVADGWTLAFSRSAEDYDEISGAFENIEFVVSPPDRRGEFFVVTTNDRPWCTSCWSVLRWTVHRLGARTQSPTLLGEGEHSFYQCGDRQLRLEPRGFSLEFEEFGEDTIPTKKVVSYEVREGRVVARDQTP